MNLLKQTFVIIGLSGSLFAQKNAILDKNPVISPVSAPQSNILGIHISDSSIVKVELKNALYDPKKNNLPYFLVSKKTAFNQSALPTLIIKKTAVVTEKYASVIRKYLSSHLTAKFEVFNSDAIARNENLNHTRVYPFRLNSQNQIEELIDFEIDWQIVQNKKQTATASFKNNSVLQNGTWYKIGLTKTGIYKIDKNFLISIGINVNGLDPKKIRIYGNGGQTVPELNSAFRYDDLEENAIIVYGESDGVFNDNDYVLFYGTEVNAWKKTNNTSGLKFSRIRNYYSDTSFYFINVDLGNGKRMQTQASSSSPANVNSNSYDYYNFHELESSNFVKSGRQFFGEYFDINSSYNFMFNDNYFVPDSLFAEVAMAGRGATPTMFSITGNGLNGSISTTPVNITSYLDPYADVQTTTISAVNTNPGSISLTFTKLTPGNIGWLDYVTINARRSLNASKQFSFRDSRVAGTGNICNYTITNPGNVPLELWNVSDHINPFIQQYNSGSGSIDFKAPADSIIEYAVSPAADFYAPVFVGKIGNQNLHAVQQADYVIITHPLFTSYAQRMAALHQPEGLSYVIATTDQIYNEFSSGKQDASAIRDFIRMLYVRNTASQKQPKHVLLIGDGSYNNKDRKIGANSNLIPTYESAFSLSLLQSTATDDFYGLMDNDEGANAENYGWVDIGIGRFIGRSQSEIASIVTKCENYYRKDPNFQISDSNIENCTTAAESPLRDWRNWVLFMGDDEDQATHMSQADNLALQLQTNYPVYNQDKIYLDSYQRFSTPGGHRYPDAQADMNKRVKKGALVFNYTGHGGEVGLTAERVLDLEIINNWDNFNNLPLFVTATCEFSRYDDPGRTSAGEYCLINPKGGAIALMTTCRLAFSSTNFVLNTYLLNYLFKKLPDGKMPALGDVVRETKAALGQSIYYANFHLLGDPALRLAYPEYKIITSKINNATVTPTSSDTLGALAKITVTGFVADTAGNKLTNFNGLIYPTVFDKEQDVSGLLNDPSSYESLPGNPFKFKMQKNFLYKGKAEVKNGDFSFSFIVPKDISFAFGPGKISYYATNGTTDANGYYKKVIVGGGSKSTIVDNEGPQVNIFMNDKNFVNGGTTNEKPVMYANLTDSSGINTLGTGIGHDISVVLDQNTTKPIILNDYYEAALNSYQSGRVRYPFEELPEGNHTLTFKVWDIQNNSNLVNIDFVVASSGELALNHVLNYPNPFSSKTKFFFEHNQACNPLKVTVQVFTISGKLVKTIQTSVTCEGFRPEGIDWDGKDDFGDKLARGVYIYKVGILNADNKKAEKTEKLVILN